MKKSLAVIAVVLLLGCSSTVERAAEVSSRFQKLEHFYMSASSSDVKIKGTIYVDTVTNIKYLYTEGYQRSTMCRLWDD